MRRPLSPRQWSAIFAGLKAKGLLRSRPKLKIPATVEDLTKAYKIPKIKKPASGPEIVSGGPAPRRIKRVRTKRAPHKQEIVIKIETPKAVTPEKPKVHKPKPEQEAPKLEGAAKEAEAKTRREKFVEGAETVSAGETYTTAAAGLFGFLRKRRKAIKAGAKRAGVAGAEGAVAGGAGTAVYAVATREEEKNLRRRKRKGSS